MYSIQSYSPFHGLSHCIGSRDRFLRSLIYYYHCSVIMMIFVLRWVCVCAQCIWCSQCLSDRIYTNITFVSILICTTRTDRHASILRRISHDRVSPSLSDCPDSTYLNRLSCKRLRLTLVRFGIDICVYSRSLLAGTIDSDARRPDYPTNGHISVKIEK